MSTDLPERDEGEPGRDPSWAAMTWGEIVALGSALWPLGLVACCALIAHLLASLK